MPDKIDLKTVLHVAQIARLSLSESEAKQLEKELDEILSEFSKISEIREKGAEVHYIRRPKARLRKDAPAKTEPAPIVSQFSKSEDGFMSAPKSL